ncbi:PucR family transcriptional regulator [Filobacillus milosensis]|uniref:PucR family transcriptional regulator n=1 Tax=Filobacillus milosensis TaxID=94137 RepID=A0A4Y8IDZ1_9BACI|nr:PucR family transcriptional regulator [Filobacillus milosensis]TFB14156.1 PucR family transcriptional regulator [Filobacillus milosensis]
MGILMEQVVDLNIMEDANVITGHEHLKDTTVEWVSVMEVPVENFVRKHEFVLTTGIGCTDDPILFEKFVKDVIHSGASALTVATGRHILDVPDRVTELAESYNFILIEIPWKVRFSDIIQEVIDAINQENEWERLQAEELRQRLTSCVLSGGSLQDILSLLHQRIKIPVAISDQRQMIRANFDFDSEVINVLNGHADGKIEKLDEPEVPLDEHPLYHHLDQYVVNDQTCYELSIFSNDKKQGYLLFNPNDTKDLSWFTMNALEHGLTACALYFLTENAIETTEIRLKDNFLLDLAKEKQELTTKIISKGELLGYDLTKSYACMVGDFKSKNMEEHENERSVQSSLHSLNYYVQKEITHASQQLQRVTMSTFDEGEVIIFIETDDFAYQENVNHFLDMVERRLHDQLTHLDLAWGIGFHRGSGNVFYESYQQARTALDIHTRQNGFGERTFFEETRVNRILMLMTKEDEVVKQVQELLQPLIEYDHKRNTDLIQTFLTYQKFKGNVSQTARALNLHRQSLLYRLRNIEKLTQLSLVDADDSFLLEFSVRLWMLNKFKD